MKGRYQLPLNFEQIRSLIYQLLPQEKNQILQELNIERRSQQLDNLLMNFHAEDLTLKKSTAEVEAVRTANCHQTQHVTITSIGNSRLISPVGESWDSCFEEYSLSPDFMNDREQPTDQEREPF